MNRILLSALALAVTATAANAQQATKASGPSDAEIAAIVVAANAIDAEIGDLAIKRGSTEAIRDFGKTMGIAHRAVNASAVELVTRLKVTPLDNDVSRKLQADAKAFTTELKKKKGKEFDRAYIQHEVDYHKAVIDAVDQLLIPSAQNEDLKNTLIGVRPAFVGHLEHAQHLLAEIK
jgi:putative membrane protein